MKVLRRTLCSWSNGASALGFAFITDNRDINGILMIRNRHQDFRNGRFLVSSAAIVVRLASLNFNAAGCLDRTPKGSTIPSRYLEPTPANSSSVRLEKRAAESGPGKVGIPVGND
jgi:hypothetical protein